MSQPTTDLQPPTRPAAQLRSAGWFVRRAFIGVFAISIFMFGGAWLLHASIEPDASSAGEQSQSE